MCWKAESDLKIEEVSAYINESKVSKWKTRNKTWWAVSNGTSNSRNDSIWSVDRSSRKSTPKRKHASSSREWTKKIHHFDDVVSKLPVRETPRVMNLKLQNSWSNSWRRKNNVVPIFKNHNHVGQNRPKKILSQLKKKNAKGNSLVKIQGTPRVKSTEPRIKVREKTRVAPQRRKWRMQNSKRKDSCHLENNWCGSYHEQLSAWPGMKSLTTNATT